MLRRRRPSGSWFGPVACLVGAAALLSGCTGGTQPAPTGSSEPTAAITVTTVAPSPSASASVPVEASPTPAAPTVVASPPASSAALPSPGATCDPSDGDPNCTDSLDAGHFVYVEGYADCVAAVGGPAPLCIDLDEDGHAGYPDEEGSTTNG